MRRDLEDAFRGIEEARQRAGGALPPWLIREWTEEQVVFTQVHDASKKRRHGRRETRELWALADPEHNGYVGSAGVKGAAWPHVAQIARLHRTRTLGDQTATERGYLVTSVPPLQADASALLAYSRGEWRIENRLHWVRDETLGEDRSQIRSGAAPQVMAALRNLVVYLLRREGEPNIAAALRRYAGRPASAVALVLSAGVT